MAYPQGGLETLGVTEPTMKRPIYD